MNESYSIKDIVRLLLGHIWLIMIFAILGAGAAFGYTKLMMPLQYSSHISMYVQSYNNVAQADNPQSNISNSKQLVNTYMEVMKDDAIMDDVGELLQKEFDKETLSECFGYSGDKISPGSIRACISISSVTDTSALKLTATTKNAEVSAAICNDMTKVAPDYVVEAVGVGSINTIDTAKVYRSPVAPNVMKNTAIGGVAGLMLIVLIIFLIDFFDNTVKDPGVLSEKYHKPIIGEIAQFNIDKKKGADTHIKLTDDHVPFAVVESYKSIRTNVTFSLSTNDRKVLAVSSPNPSDGKSTTASNIAIAMAQGGSRVLLIDADMRKSILHKVFELKNKKGLSSAISKMSRLDECIQKDIMENLDVMTSGPIPPNPSELLASKNMAAILDTLTKEYDIIIIDTPPINIVSDAMGLTNLISGTVLVLRYGKTTNDEVDTALKKIELAQMNLLGFILNDIRVRRNEHYYKYNRKYGQYNYGYGYYGITPEMDEDESDQAETEPESNEDRSDTDSMKKDK